MGHKTTNLEEEHDFQISIMISIFKNYRVPHQTVITTSFWSILNFRLTLITIQPIHSNLDLTSRLNFKVAILGKEFVKLHYDKFFT